MLGGKSVWGLGVVLLVSSLCWADGRLPAPIGSFRNTYYYLIFEKNYPAGDLKDQTLLDPFGNTLAQVSARFKKDLLMEGSGQLIDGRVLNYAARIGGVSRFQFTRHPDGRGVGNCALVPFKTIAVDPSQISLGSKVYIDETAGMKLSDGTVHDGIWLAEDTGGAILHDRIDLYIGAKKFEKVLLRHGITHLQPLTIRVLNPPTASSCVYQIPE